VRTHLKTFLAEMEGEGGASLPRFVLGEFERYLGCGILANGFARVRCTACGDELLVAFSCKGRGFCPSCTSRRRYDTAASLVNRAIPNVPVASVGLVAAALGALSARPRYDADHSHARHCLAHHLRPPAPISPPLRSAGAAHRGDHLRAALRRSPQPQCA